MVEDGVRAVAAGDAPALGRALDRNQALLEALGVSSAEVEATVGAARAAGALGAKLTGGGAGGAVIALAADALRVASRLEERGIRTFTVALGDGRGGGGMSSTLVLVEGGARHARTRANGSRRRSTGRRRGSSDQQHARGYWHAPLEANATMEAEYVFFNRMLGRQKPDRERRMADRLLATQRADGSWPLWAGGPPAPLASRSRRTSR